MAVEYPENCLKGISRKNWVFGKSVRWIAFDPPENSPVTNGWYESSINWEFDEGAINHLLYKRNGDEFQFKGGVVRIPRAEIDRIIEQYEVSDRFRYEYKPIRDGQERNEYHGNWLLHERLHKAKGENKQDKATILGALTRAVVYHFKQEGD